MRQLAAGVCCAALAYLGFQYWAERDAVDTAIRQYEIVKRNGNAAEVCVEAGVVAGVYLSLGDEPNYQKWLAAQRVDCRRAGLAP